MAQQAKNTKTILIAVAVLLLVILGIGAYKFLMMKKTSLQGEVAQQGNTAQQNGNVFTSIKDALSKSVSLQCDFTDEAGRKTTGYIKAGAIRADIVASTAQESGSVIIKNNKMYFWNSKEGMMLDLTDTVNKNQAKAPGGAVGQERSDSIMNSFEQYKQKCKPAVVSDSLFTPPADVKFTNLSDLMKTPSGVPDIKQYQKLVPSSVPQETSQPSDTGTGENQ